MSELHPIVAATGSSGSGTSSVKTAFEHIFRREGINPAIVEGDSFHRFDRATMEAEVERAEARGQSLTHFGPAGNLLGADRTVSITVGSGKRMDLTDRGDGSYVGRVEAKPGTRITVYVGKKALRIVDVPRRK